MEEIKEKLVHQFKLAGASPFLFIGSGFSRRYLDLEDWGSLLRRFTVGLRDYEFYFSSANADLPTVASLIANDFHDYWWSSDQYAASREKHKTKIKDRTTALRLEICEYLNSIKMPPFSESKYSNEVSLLSQLNVDGVITTNWDQFTESIFPDYRVFVGQSELLFANPQSIAEIYKIHGSSSSPESLVLTKDDYERFESQNTYLAAKLITIFVEHPIVFIGYSLADKNISTLLKSIVTCLGEGNLQKLSNNLVFVQRAKGDAPSVTNTLLTIEGAQLPITLVKTDDFIHVYEAIDEVKRKLPTRILRLCKEQLFELVKSSDPVKKLCVVDIDDIENREDVEFVIGVGVSSLPSAPTQIGYQGISAVDLFKDLVVQDREFDANSVLTTTVVGLSKKCKYLPVYKYLFQAGVTADNYLHAHPLIKPFIHSSPKGYQSDPYAQQYSQSESLKSAKEIISSHSPEKAAVLLPFVPRDRFDLETVRLFLVENIEKIEAAHSAYSTYFRKLCALYDYYRYGPEAAA